MQSMTIFLGRRRRRNLIQVHSVKCNLKLVDDLRELFREHKIGKRNQTSADYCLRQPVLWQELGTLSRLSFPRGRGLCTTFAIEVRLRQGPPALRGSGYLRSNSRRTSDAWKTLAKLSRRPKRRCETTTNARLRRRKSSVKSSTLSSRDPNSSR